VRDYLVKVISDRRAMKKLGFVVTSLFSTGFLLAATDLKPVDLKCEYRVNPLGIEETRPRLSWKVESDLRGQKQTAYRILVASNTKTLAADRGDLWDSGRKESGLTNQIEYNGGDLLSRQPCFWKVKVWDVEELRDRKGVVSGSGSVKCCTSMALS
jgi:alpha-L-rhamnosidase